MSPVKEYIDILVCFFFFMSSFYYCVRSLQRKFSVVLEGLETGETIHSSKRLSCLHILCVNLTRGKVVVLGASSPNTAVHKKKHLKHPVFIFSFDRCLEIFVQIKYDVSFCPLCVCVCSVSMAWKQ